MRLQTPLTLALSKGRILDQALPLLAQAGIAPLEDLATSRKLIIETAHPLVRLVIIRAADVPTYVEYGAADLGVTGKDILMEHGGSGLYEPLDLGIARCRLMVAGRPDSHLAGHRRPRVATKYVHTAERHFAAKGQQAEVIKLYGSMELAPLVGLADLIVDLVESGNTLKANGLVPLELIAEISSRLIVNKAAWKMKHESVMTLLAALRAAVAPGQ
ncbi:ATP phosphoribosyltransferase [Caldichromatium japonicum]|uniref:ATP phosphoribosyltransferase n=1 Tax=Caldichromatium japonicum TaxID=2699430 RepID=A0A6G7VAI7_9GAMM|nr:ATP phosphoribosyltransferase [Caldichromatium japonicum]QIK36962.1 ATP phosphoribosyltransferase [Caldichromatium japonicum]